MKIDEGRVGFIATMSFDEREVIPDGLILLIERSIADNDQLKGDLARDLFNVLAAMRPELAT